MSKHMMRLRVMICEDEPVIVIAMSGAMEAFDCEPAGPFAFSRDARQALKENHIDAAILDVELADGASTQLARKPREAGVRMIVLSSLQTASPPPEFAGVDRLLKPADEPRLRDFCAAVIATARTGSASAAGGAAGTRFAPEDLMG